MSVDLTIIIVNYNTKKITLECIDSIRKFTKNINYEIIVIDNGSTQRFEIPKLQINTNLKLIKNKTNLGFSGANNQGMKIAKGRYILLLNSDTLINDNVLGEMIEWLNKYPKIGIATCALKNADKSLQGTGGYFPTLLRVFSWMIIQDIPFVDKIIKPFHPKSYFYTSKHELDWITGAFMLIRHEVIDEIGFFDNRYFMYTEDTDLCFRAKAKGWKVIYNPKWAITHFGGKSSTKEFPLLSEFKGVKYFYKKHYQKWQYPILRFLLKLGSIWRIVLINPKIYAKAFKIA